MKNVKKVLSIILSMVMVLSVMPLANITAFAASPGKNSVAYISKADSFTAYKYYDSLQAAFDAACGSSDYKQVNVYKDITLDEPIVVNTQSTANVNVEFNGHTVSAPNGDAFDVDLDFTLVFGLYSYYFNERYGADFARSYGGIKAKGYAVNADFLSDKNVHIYGCFYGSDDYACPFNVGELVDETSSNQAVKLWYAGLIGCQATDLASRVRVGGNKTIVKRSFCVYETSWDDTTALIVGREDVHSYITVQNGVDEDGDVLVDHICSLCDYVDATADYPDAKVGDTFYYYFSEAVAGCEPNAKSTITLLLNVTNKVTVNFNEAKDITLDLNGYTLDQKAGYFVIKNGKLKIENGTIKNGSNSLVLLYGTKDKTATDYSVLDVENATIDSYYDGSGTAIVIDIDEDKWVDGAKIDQRGQYGIKVDFKDSQLISDTIYVGLTINGQYANYNEATCPKVNFDNCRITAAYLPLYLSGYGITNINNCSIGTMDVGIELRAGLLNIDGENTEIISTSTEESSVVYYTGSGSTGTSIGVCVSQHSTGHPTTLNIYNGVIKAMTPVYEKVVVPSYDVKTPGEIAINIYGGKFASTNETDPQVCISQNVEKFIYGGDYSNNPKAYVAKGYSVKGIEENPYFYRVDKVINEVSLSVDETIQNNVYLDLEGYIDADDDNNKLDDITFEFEHINAPNDYSNTTKKQSLAHGDATETVDSNGTTQYVYTYKSNPAQICEPAIVKIYNRNQLVDELDCSMLTYCNNAIAIAQKENATDKQVANGLLSHRLKDYATAAQVEFNAYTTKVVNGEVVSNLANEGVYQEDVKDVTSADFTKKSSFSQNATGLTITSVSFMSLSESGVNFDFDLADGCSINDYDVELTQGIDGSNIKAEFEVSKYRNIIVVSGIEAANLDEQFVVTVTNKKDGTKTVIKYSALDYARTVMLSSKSESLKQFARTLYLYNDAANAYFAI